MSVLLQERLAAEEKSQHDRSKAMDGLASYLVQYGDITTLSPEETQQLYHKCLTDFKSRVLEQLDLLQDRHEKVERRLSSFRFRMGRL